jgi:4-amino-4-deoxy-L-arabinose transferase-like glycosyltransferase
MPAVAASRARFSPVWVLLGLLLLGVLGCNRGLWTPDEPREAEISREMALAPSFIPTLNGQRFIEKPPLYYWVVAAAYRLTGAPSVLAARAVSVVAGWATLLLLLHWGATARSLRAGLIAACLLATSVQFIVSSHWVLIDPLLMLTTTLAAWAAWELLAQRTDSAPRRLLLYLALLLALWIKGLVGPALIIAGLAAYVLVDRPPQWRRLRPWSGVVLLGVAVGTLALAIASQGGAAAVWEWAYVNHVRRLVDPLGSSGHRQPLLYYVWTLPYAMLPWLLPLIEALRPAHWRRSTPLPQAAEPNALLPLASPEVGRFGALMAGGMLLLLSLSATKRETYLLPVLPLLFLWLGVRTEQWWLGWRQQRARQLGLAWWLQVALLSVYCLLPPVAARIFLGHFSASILLAFALAAVPTAALLWLSGAGKRGGAGVAALIAAFAGAGVLLALAPTMLDDTKDMGPFVQALGQHLPPGQAVYAVNIDETLAAEIGFYTGRQALAVDLQSLPQPLPRWLLLQDNHERNRPAPGPDYLLVAERNFGPRRSLALWQLRDRTPQPQAR